MKTRADRAIRHVSLHESPSELRQRAISRLLRAGVSTEGDVAAPVLTINFHPDRPTTRGDMVIESVLETGRLLNQFETRTTNGLTINEKEHARPRRESALFGGVYDESEPSDRPKYGAVSLTGNPRGGWPRYGSAYWLLEPAIAQRSTVTVGDSISARSWCGTFTQFRSLVADVRSTPPLGLHRHRFHLIDGAVELQVHGAILVPRDVVGLYLDPSFRGTRVEDAAREMTARFQLSFAWVPKLSRAGSDWRLSLRREYACSRVAEALSRQEPITAQWIGVDLLDSARTHVPMHVRHGAARYLWNRLLLSQDCALISRHMNLSAPPEERKAE